MKYIKKNKVTLFIILIFICLVVVLAETKKLLVPDEGKASYGNRLDNISKHKLEEKTLTGIKNSIMEDANVSKIEYKVHGKIINYMVTVLDKVSVADAKKIANSIVPLFKNGELEYYSLQVYVIKEDSKLNNFPIIGYKGVNAKELSFTKDREIVNKETSDEK